MWVAGIAWLMAHCAVLGNAQEEVSCEFAVDDSLVKVYIDGEDKTNFVVGNRNIKTVIKTITFDASASTIAVITRDRQTGCDDGAFFAMRCTSANSTWDGMVADSTWRVQGSTSANPNTVCPDGATGLDYDDSGWPFAVHAMSRDDTIVGVPGICAPLGRTWCLRKTISGSPEPTGSPTEAPTTGPTLEPTMSPTDFPTVTPTPEPTPTPTQDPTTGPTREPTKSPTDSPTMTPTLAPTMSPVSCPEACAWILATPTPTATPTQEPEPMECPEVPEQLTYEEYARRVKKEGKREPELCVRMGGKVIEPETRRRERCKPPNPKKVTCAHLDFFDDLCMKHTGCTLTEEGCVPAKLFGDDRQADEMTEG